jgi:hypothetical protein
LNNCLILEKKEKLIFFWKWSKLSRYVGGMRYNVAAETLMKHEHTMLAKMISERWNKGINQEPLFNDS